MSQSLDELALYYHEQLPDEIRAYLRSRGLSDEIIDRHQLGWGGWRITIPIWNRALEVAFFKLARSPHDRSDAPKMLTTPGSSAELYGWEQVVPGNERLIVCEGEFDRLVLESRGYPAVTSTAGAITFRREWADALKIVPNVYVCFDRDPAGVAGAVRVGRMIPHARIVRLPEELGIGGDVSDFFVKAKGSDERFEELLEAAEPLPDILRAERRVPAAAPDGREIDRLKSTVRLEDIASKYGRLERRGKGLITNCFFHDDREPSLVIYPDTQSFFCFGCQAGGDVVSFLMRAGGMNFKEAVEELRRLAA